MDARSGLRVARETRFHARRMYFIQSLAAAVREGLDELDAEKDEESDKQYDKALEQREDCMDPDIVKQEAFECMREFMMEVSSRVVGDQKVLFLIECLDQKCNCERGIKNVQEVYYMYLGIDRRRRIRHVVKYWVFLYQMKVI